MLLEDLQSKIQNIKVRQSNKLIAELEYLKIKVIFVTNINKYNKKLWRDKFPNHVI